MYACYSREEEGEDVSAMLVWKPGRPESPNLVPRAFSEVAETRQVPIVFTGVFLKIEGLMKPA